MKSKINWLIINLISLAAISLVIAININSRLVDQENKIKEIEWTIQEHELSIQRLAEQIPLRAGDRWFRACGT